MTVPLPVSDRIVMELFESYFSRLQRSTFGAENWNTAVCGRNVDVLWTMHFRRLWLSRGVSRRLFPDVLPVRNKTATGKI